jgi:hypothetical protein
MDFIKILKFSASTDAIKKVKRCRKLMWVNSLYSYPYLNQQKPLFLPIMAYTLSTTKLEIRAK